jgi:hypothetical protein
MRIKASFFAAAITLVLTVVPSLAMSMGNGFHGASSTVSHGAASTAARHPYSPAINSRLVLRTGPVALKKKQGKLNGACYRSCVKTSMGDAFRTDQFCAYSCSLD